ncbi:hypothetical protein Tco_0724331 [Tanacetum coccineum]
MKEKLGNIFREKIDLVDTHKKGVLKFPNDEKLDEFGERLKRSKDNMNEKMMLMLMRTWWCKMVIVLILPPYLQLEEYWKQEPRSLVMCLTQRVIKQATRSCARPFIGEKVIAWYPPDIRKEDHTIVALEEKERMSNLETLKRHGKGPPKKGHGKRASKKKRKK